MTSFVSTAIGNVMNGPVAWIAVDWGTSNLRAWAMAEEGRVIANAASEAGMARLSRDDFEPTLLSVVDGWLTSGRKTRIVACGMVGARQGWMEAAYASVPWKGNPLLFASPVVRAARFFGGRPFGLPDTPFLN